MNPFYNAMNQQNPMQMLNSLKGNARQFLIQRKFNLPQNIDANNPQEITNYLVQSGQVSQDAINRAYKIAQSMK